MREPRTWQTARAPLAAVAALVAAGLLLAACGEKDEEPTVASTATTTSESTIADVPEGPKKEGADKGGAGKGETDGDAADGPGAKELAQQRAIAGAERSYRRYIAALNAADGTVLCASIDPSFQSELKLPAPRGSCAERLSASIGYADPSGAPVWKATQLNGIESSIVGKDEKVQLSAAITTEFADRDEPSIESDIVFLEPIGKGERKTYRLMKAPGSLWRAVGAPDIPPSVITPPESF